MVTSVFKFATAARIACVGLAFCGSARAQGPSDYARGAGEVMRQIDAGLRRPDGLYAHSLTDRSPDFSWGNGVMLTALIGAARHDSAAYRPTLDRFFVAMNRYWDAKARIPGYEPAPTAGNGDDKYYDDNAWIAIACVEAFELTGDRRYLDRADATLRFVLSGWDDARGGGIWWHEGHKDDGKNTCVNAPAAVACLRLATHRPPARAAELVATARRIVDWTIATLADPQDGLFFDHVKVESGKLDRAKLTYNTALMIRADLGLFAATGDDAFRRRAEKVADASSWFLDAKTGVYRDAVKWSHLMVEADCEMYRATGRPEFLKRATDNADHWLAAFRRDPPAELIDQASIARMLWLVDAARRPR